MRNINNEIGDYQQKKLFFNTPTIHNQKKVSQYPSRTKNLETDAQFKSLIQQYDLQISMGNDKQKKIERITQQNIKVAQQNKKILIQISQLQEEIQNHKNQKMEQEKNQQQEQSEMKEFMYALKLQSHGLQSLGLNSQEIDLIPTFSYQKGFESQICLSCFQQLQNNANIKCLPCCHIFHDNCIGQFLKQSRYCPACSQEVVVIS